MAKFINLLICLLIGNFYIAAQRSDQRRSLPRPNATPPNLSKIKEDKIKFAQNLRDMTKSPLRPDRYWYNYVPPCPCSYADPNRYEATDWKIEEDSWFRVIFGFGLQHFHPGASYSIRTARDYPAPKGESLERGHGQQCTFGADGKLLPPSHPGAGTPDYRSSNYSLLDHRSYDVLPFDILGYKIYNQFWVPSAGCEDKFNVVVGPKFEKREGFDGLPLGHPARNEEYGARDTLLDVNKGDVLNFDVKGKVTLYSVSGGEIESGPEGLTKEATLHFLRTKPKPDPDPWVETSGEFPINGGDQRIWIYPGSVRGYIFNETEGYNGDTFYIGKGGTHIAKTYGRLWIEMKNFTFSRGVTKGYFDVEIQKK